MPKKIQVEFMKSNFYKRNVNQYKVEEHEVDETFFSSYIHWTSTDGKIFVPAAPTINFLIPGFYEINQSHSAGLYFEKIPIKSEGLIRFPDTNSNLVVSEIQKFWEREEVYKEYEINYKRGIILYGPPGSGKSCTIQLIMEDVVERNGIIVKFTYPSLFINGIRALRKIQSDTPIVVIMEDIDSILEIYNESEILNILDGVNELNKIVFLATTNYPEKLSPRIINRPSRFDKRFRIGYPSSQSRKIYFEHLISGGFPDKLNKKICDLNIDLNKWVKDTDGMTIAHLKELFIQVIIIGDTYDNSIKNLEKMAEIVESKDYEASMGFGFSQKSEDYYDYCD
jgi:Cdc6-like AAA superfamily ATPase